MSEPVSSRELERIYLQPRCNVDPHDGRVWCEHNVWPDDDCDEPGVEYVRADLLAEAIAATREECANTKPPRSAGSPPNGEWGGWYQVGWDQAIIAYEDAIRSIGGTDG